VIGISSMTVADVVAAIEMRAGDLMTPYNSDWQTMVNYIRDARRELFNRTNPFKEWAYQQTVQLTHLQSVPNDFMRPLRLTTTAPGNDPNLAIRYEARRVSPYEWMTLCNPARPHSFARPRESAPTYMVWANSFDNGQWASNQPALWINPTNLIGQLDYIANYGDVDVTVYTDPVRVPVEMEGLLIDMALSRFLEDVADPQRAITAAQDVATRVYEYQVSQIAARQSSLIEAQAIANPEPASLAEKPSTPGGLL